MLTLVLFSVFAVHGVITSFGIQLYFNSENKSIRKQNDQLDAIMDIDVKFTTPHEVKSMTASVIFALFLLLCFSLHVQERRNRWLTYWKQ